MRHLLLVCGLFTAAVLLLTAPSASANGIDNFTFIETQGSDTVMITWQLPSSPTPDMVDPGDFVVQNVSSNLYADGVLVFSSFPDSFTFLTGGGVLEGLGYSLTGGLQMFTGPLSAPEFTPGTYFGSDPNFLDANGCPDVASLTIGTPEPSVLLLLFSGFLALVGALALKKVQV